MVSTVAHLKHRHPLVFRNRNAVELIFFMTVGTFAVVALLVRSATSEISDTLIYDQFDNQTYVSDLFTRGQVATTLSAVVGILQVGTAKLYIHICNRKESSRVLLKKILAHFRSLIVYF